MILTSCSVLYSHTFEFNLTSNTSNFSSGEIFSLELIALRTCQKVGPSMSVRNRSTASNAFCLKNFVPRKPILIPTSIELSIIGSYQSSIRGRDGATHYLTRRRHWNLCIICEY